jgi:hypothetical protein
VIRNLTRNPAVQKIHTRLTTFSNRPVSGFSGQVPHAARDGDVLRGAKELIVFPRMGCDENRDPGRLLLEHQGWTTDSIPLEAHTHLDAVGNLYERYAAVHSVFLAVKGHNP